MGALALVDIRPSMFLFYFGVYSLQTNHSHVDSIACKASGTLAFPLIFVAGAVYLSLNYVYALLIIPLAEACVY